MNHCYRLVWNRLRQCLVVAAEIARGRRKAGRGRHVQARHGWALVGALALAPLPAMAGTAVPGNAAPIGGQVTAGQGSIQQTGTATTIEQRSQQLALAWQGFDVGTEHTVNFVQPNALAIAVNRISDPHGSTILGRIQANGQVFLLNPNGVLFGPTAQVSVGGLVASTLDFDDGQLASGVRRFTGSGRGSVVNQGTLRAAAGGYVALVGPQVTNRGTLAAPGGTVAMGGGDAVTLSFDADRLLSLQVERSTLDALADNRQLIQADGGQVLMSAGAKDAVLASVVNNSGLIQAQTVGQRDGRIVLLGGMQAGTTTVAGTLDASAPHGGDGGFIETSAARVTVADGARVGTLAPHGAAGTWLIDPQDYRIATSGGDITGATLSANLGSGNVAIQSASGATAGAGNIKLDDAVAWSADTTLTLTAGNDVNINANVTATGATAGLVLAPDTANGGEAASGTGKFNLNNGAVITLSGANPSLSIAGQSYVVINSLGAADSNTGTDLQGMRANLAGHYVLGSDIDANATAGWNGGSGFTAIGTNTDPFGGAFDGLGHTITGLHGPNFFGTTDTGSTIRNVGLLQRRAAGEQFVGGLVQYNNGALDQVHVSGTLSATRGYVGGLAYSNKGVIDRAHADGTVDGRDFTAGLVASNTGGGTITRSYSTAAVSGTTYVGGLVGVNNGIIRWAYATGAVSGVDLVGGLVGSAQSTGSIVTQTWASGAVSGTGPAVGGFAGYGNSSVSASYWDRYSTGQTKGVGSNNRAVTYAITSDPAQAGAANYAFQASAYTGFDFAPASGTWFMLAGNTRPFLQSEYGINIGNAHQLQLMAMNLGAAYTLAGSLDASETGRAISGAAAADAGGMWSKAGFSPLGSDSSRFTGSLDGLGHTINGLAGAAFFGTTAAGSSIRNVGLLQRAATTAGNYFGGMVATNYGLLDRVFVEGTVSGGFVVGGLVGGNYATISRAYVSGTVSGGNIVGGLVGLNAPGATLTESYSTAAVSGDNSVGGLVGVSSGGTISDAYATGAVSGSNQVGGFAGGVDAASSVTRSWSSGKVTGGSRAAGFAGYGFGPITDSYWDSYSSGQAAALGAGTTTGASAVTSDPAQASAPNYAFAPGAYPGWDLASVGGSSSVWRIYAGQTMPLLRTFMTALPVAIGNATGTYNGTAFAGSDAYTLGTPIPTYWLPSVTANPALVLGQAHTTTPALDVGSYALDAGLYSTQLGYDITLTPGPLTITPAPLAVTGAAAASKTYDGTTSASISGATLTGTIYGSDAVSLANASAGQFADKNAGTGKAVSTAATLAGASADNYQLIQQTGLVADIGKAGLTVSDITAVDKVYDGTPAATLISTSATFSGLLGSDQVTAHATGSFSDKNAGVGKVVNITGISLGGADGGNYAWAATGASTTATITPAPLGIGTLDISKVYDGSTAATGTPIAVTGSLFGTDSLSGGTFTFDTRDVGTGKTVTVAGVTVDDGNGGANYAVTYVPNTHSRITARPVVLAPIASVSGITAADKVYDGSTTATLDFAGAVFNGMASGDHLAVAGAHGAFDDKNAGTAKTVHISGITLGGGDAANYTLLDPTATTTADILPAPLTYIANVRTEPAGRAPGGLSGAVGGLVGGDTLATATSGTLVWHTNATAASAPGSYAIEGTGLTARNYQFHQAPGNASALTLTAATEGDPGTGNPGTGGTGHTDGNGSNGGATGITAPGLAAIYGRLQQATPFAGTHPAADDADAPASPVDALYRGSDHGLPVPYVRIVDGGVRMQ